MDDDDDFGDLYADVLRPLPLLPSPQLSIPTRIPSPPKPQTLPPSPSPSPPRSPARAAPEDSILGPAPIPEVDPPPHRNEEDDRSHSPSLPKPDPSPIRADDVSKAAADGEQGIGDFDIECDIPGLGAGAVFDVKPEGNEEWDSDSDDDLRIVLNNDVIDGAKGGSDEDDDGEDDLVIVTDDVRHVQYQGMEEQDWGEEALQAGMDGEKKDGAEAAKGVPGAGAVAGQRAGYGHVYHPQHHSQFKYIRPGVVEMPGSAAVVHGAPGQLRPPLTMGIVPGRGRGVQKGFHSGHGFSTWANNNLARPFGIGLDVILPSHKTIFDLSIDGFDEKPWKLPGIDITDFFNFGLDEDGWRDYCKQLEQFRVESTMQSKIRVYESGRSDHDYDPDLPPELAAATGHQDLSSEKMLAGKLDSGQLDLFNQGTTQRQSQLPTGRAIQVESGYGERLPSMDTRPPRTRDFEAIIEIVCQDFVDEADNSTTKLTKQGADPIGDGLKSCYVSEEKIRHDNPENKDNFSRSQYDRKDSVFSEVPTVGSSQDSLPDGHGISAFPLRAAGQDPYSSKTEVPSSAVENSEESPVGRQTLEQKNKSVDSCTDDGSDLELAPSDGTGSMKGLSKENVDEELGDMLELPQSPGEREDIPSNMHVSSSSHDDHNLPYYAKGKLLSQVEHPSIVANDDAEDLGATFSHHSIAKSGSSTECVKQREVGEEEVMQDTGFRDSDDFERDHLEDGCISLQGDVNVRDSQHDINGGHIPPKRSEDARLSRPQRSFDSKSADPEDFERHEERGGSTDAWTRRDANTHDLGRKDRDTKRRHSEEMRLKDRTRTIVNERKSRVDDVHLRKGSENNEWRTHFGREGTIRQRERNSVLLKQSHEDIHISRRKDEEHRKRESLPKENPHAYHVRGDSAHGRRGRNDGSESRIKEDVRMRDRSTNARASKHKDDNSKGRERVDRQRVKVEGYAHRDREEARTSTKVGRNSEDKSYVTDLKNRGDRSGADIDPSLKDRRHNQSRRGDRIKIESHSQHKSREEFNSNTAQVSREEKSSRHGRVSNQAAHSSGAFSSQNIMYREADRENSKTNKNIVADKNGLVLGKRKHEDFPINQRDKGRRTSPLDSSRRGSVYQETNHGSDSMHIKKDHRTIAEKAEGSGDAFINNRDETVSDDETLQESRRGRSKLERWTSHKERDYGLHRQPSLQADNVNGNNQDIVLCDELTMTEVNKDTETSDNKDPVATENCVKEEHDRHLETVEKLKKRSERFNLPMPGEKEVIVTKRIENEISSSAQNESTIESEIKQERPTRKRRWVSG